MAWWSLWISRAEPFCIACFNSSTSFVPVRIIKVLSNMLTILRNTMFCTHVGFVFIHLYPGPHLQFVVNEFTDYMINGVAAIDYQGHFV